MPNIITYSVSNVNWGVGFCTCRYYNWHTFEESEDMHKTVENHIKDSFGMYSAQ